MDLFENDIKDIG